MSTAPPGDGPQRRAEVTGRLGYQDRRTQNQDVRVRMTITYTMPITFSEFLYLRV